MVRKMLFEESAVWSKLKSRRNNIVVGSAIFNANPAEPSCFDEIDCLALAESLLHRWPLARRFLFPVEDGQLAFRAEHPFGVLQRLYRLFQVDDHQPEEDDIGA